MSWKKGLFVTTVTGAFLVYGLYLQRRLITERQVKRERYIEEEVKRRTEESTTNAAPTSSAEEELRKQE